MKKMLSLILSLAIAAACMGCAATGENTQNSLSETGAAEQTTQEKEISSEAQAHESLTSVTRAEIPETLAQVPEGYELPAEQQGSIERLDYTTYESMSYEEQSEELEKTAYVYLPYEYNEEEQYNVFYLMHGGWSNETTMMGTDRSPSTLKNIVDHAIEDGRMQPMIIVCPTYNNTSPEDSSDYGLALRLTDNYHNELMNDLIPAVESRYSTFADDTTPEALTASRDHRAFGGFSLWKRTMSRKVISPTESRKAEHIPENTRPSTFTMASAGSGTSSRIDNREGRHTK